MSITKLSFYTLFYAFSNKVLKSILGVSISAFWVQQVVFDTCFSCNSTAAAGHYCPSSEHVKLWSNVLTFVTLPFRKILINNMLGVNAIVNVLLLDGCEEFKKAFQSAFEQVSIVFLHNLLFSPISRKEMGQNLALCIKSCKCVWPKFHAD